MDDLNRYILKNIKRLIEDAMENEIDEDECISEDIINAMAKLHGLIKEE